MKKLIVGINDLATVHPELVKEWDYEKNGDLKPTMVTCGSGKKVWWICNKGHKWETIIYNRVRFKSNCPYCAGQRVITGMNDLATVYPNLLKIWNYKKNNVSPNKIAYGSGRKVWWICNKCGYEWFAAPSQLTNQKSKGNHCAVCANKIVLPGYNDLVTKFPEVAREWNHEKNGDLLPTMVTFGSVKKVWWKCSKGHEWIDTILHRTRIDKQYGCPYCSHHKVLKGINDLATLYPDLAKEWHPSKNGNLTPSDVLPYSSKKVWWKCYKGHEWQARISGRSKGVGCPYCNSQFQTSFSEQAVFYYIKKYYNCNVYSRYIISTLFRGYELDIFIPDFKIAIEYDGVYYHRIINNKSNFEKSKDKVVKELGIKLIRIKEGLKNCINEVKNNVIIFNPYIKRYQNLSWAITELLKMLEFDNNIIDVNIERDRIEILKSYIKLSLSKSLQLINPQLAKEWHPTKNGNLIPEMFTANSGEIVWWKCKYGHEWQSSIAKRNGGSNCPYCLNHKVLKGVNDLATLYPNLAKEWHPFKNNGKYPSDFKSQSGKKVWWLCSKCGYEWESRIQSRTKQNCGCPECAKNKRKRK